VRPFARLGQFPVFPEQPLFYDPKPAPFAPPPEQPNNYPPPIEDPYVQVSIAAPFNFTTGNTAEDAEINTFIQEFPLNEITSYEPSVNPQTNRNFQECLQQLIFKDVIAWQFTYKQDEKEAVYVFFDKDSDGKELSGVGSTSCYEMIFNSAPPNNAFWSITVYDSEGYLVANDEENYGISSVNVEQVDSRFSVLFTTIENKPTNLPDYVYWVVIPEQVFNLVLRIYLPTDPEYKPPKIRKLTTCTYTPI
jgi:hypothetical protein